MSLSASANFTRAAIAAGLLLMHAVVVSAQDVTEAALKAAFIYNFAKFTEWPAEAVPAAQPFVMCVLGDRAISEALGRAIKGRALAGRSIAVSHLTPAGPPQGCHVLYVSGVTNAQAAQLVAGIRDVPILTISDIEGFMELGGVAQFFFENGQLRFGVRHESATRARLQISSRLLALAKRR